MKTLGRVLGFVALLVALVVALQPFARNTQAANQLFDPAPKYIASPNLLLTSTATATVGGGGTVLTDSARSLATSPGEWPELVLAGKATAAGTTTTLVDTSRTEFWRSLISAWIDFGVADTNGNRFHRITFNDKDTGTLTFTPARATAIGVDTTYKIIRSIYHLRWILIGGTGAAADVEQISHVNPGSGVMTISGVDATKARGGTLPAITTGDTYRLVDGNPKEAMLRLKVTDDAVGTCANRVQKYRNVTQDFPTDANTLDRNVAPALLTDPADIGAARGAANSYANNYFPGLGGTATECVAVVRTIGQAGLEPVVSKEGELTSFEGQTLEATYGLWNKQITVDTVSPVITGVRVIQGDRNVAAGKKNTVAKGAVTIQFDVTDANSGMEPDKDKLRRDPVLHTDFRIKNTTAVDLGSYFGRSSAGEDIPNGQFSLTVGIPPVNKVTTAFAGDQFVFAVDLETADIVAIPGGWRVSYRTAFNAGEVWWQLRAKDRAGKDRTSDGDADSPGSQPYILIVDDGKPKMDAALTATGVWWDGSKTAGNRLRPPALPANRTVDDFKRNVLRVKFTDEAAPGIPGSALDETTVQPSDFSVDGVAPIGVLIVDVVNENLPSPKRETFLDVFLTMAGNLASGAKPRVSIVGDIRDKAGNLADTTPVDATDGMAPNVVTTLNRRFSRESITITMASDETLQGLPDVNLSLQRNKDGATSSGAAPPAARETLRLSSSQTGATTYSATVRRETAPDSNLPRLVNVEIGALDVNGNGGPQVAGKDNSKSALAIAFEIDPLLNNGFDPEFTVAGTKVVSTGNTQTAAGVDTSIRAEIEAVDPLLITVAFNRQCTAMPGGACTGVDGAKGEEEEYFGDTHKTVTVTNVVLEVTLSDGAKVKPAITVSSSDKITYTIAVSNAPTGEYKLTLNAEDEAGNNSKIVGVTVADEIKVEGFKVVVPKPVELPMSPGWNLISLPFEPANPAVNSVIGADHPVSLVMTYDSAKGLWLVSRRDPTTKLFTGDVRTMSARAAYFAYTDRLEPLKVIRPGLATAAAAPAVPPAIAVKVGWNLVPVVSNAASLRNKDIVGSVFGVDADTYFGTLRTGTGTAAWLRALAWQTSTQTWRSLPPVGDVPAVIAANTTAANNRCPGEAAGTKLPQVCIGEGLWVWSTIDGVIIP